MGRSLHIVLAAQRVHACAGLTQVAGQESQIDQCHYGLGSLHVLGQAKTMKTDGGAGSGIQPGGGANASRINAARRRGVLGRPCPQELRESGQPRGPALDELVVIHVFVDDDLRQRICQRQIGARLQLQVKIGAAGELGAPRIDDDEPGPVAGRLPDASANHRVALGRIRAPEEDRAGTLQVVEALVAIPAPTTCFRPAALGAWHTRAQQSTLFVPRMTRASFCAT